MARFSIDIPIWATLYVEADTAEAALTIVRETCARQPWLSIGDDMAPFEGVGELSEMATVHPLPADITADECD